MWYIRKIITLLSEQVQHATATHMRKPYNRTTKYFRQTIWSLYANKSPGYF